MKTKRYLMIFTLLAILLSACAAASTPIMEEIAEIQAEASMAEKPATEPEPSSDLSTPTDGEAPGSPGQLAYEPVGNKMVIKDAQLDLLVQSTDVAIAQVNQLTADYDGYIISTQSWYENGFKHATLRLGIPSGSFETVINQLRDLGLKVIQESASGQDVTNEYVDLQSKLTNLEATAARVREFLADAKTIDETLTISAQLAELEGQIEEVKGQMRYYEGRSAYSTVTLNLVPQHPTPTPTLTPTPTPTPTPLPGWSASDAVDNASEVMVNMTQSTIDVLIWFGIVLLPIITIIGIVIWISRWVMLKIMRPKSG